MALTNQLDKTKIGLILKRKTVERREKERRRRRRRRRREEEENKRSSSKAKLRYGTMTFSMDTCFRL